VSLGTTFIITENWGSGAGWEEFFSGGQGWCGEILLVKKSTAKLEENFFFPDNILISIEKIASKFGFSHKKVDFCWIMFYKGQNFGPGTILGEQAGVTAAGISQASY